MIVVTVALTSLGRAQTQTIVRVLAYPFPPFLNEDMKTGLTVDLTNLLNQKQSEFIFDLHVQSPKRRYMGISNGMYDIVLFEMPQWGWNKKNVTYSTTREIMKGGEVYITSAKFDRDQSYFNTLKNKKISAYFGYHYGFANFNANRSWLQKHFKIGLHTSHKRIIDLVVKGKVDVGVVTYSYLQKYLLEYPDVSAQILISEKFDQHYSLSALLGSDSTIDSVELEKLLDGLKMDGSLHQLFLKYGLLDQLTY